MSPPASDPTWRRADAPPAARAQWAGTARLPSASAQGHPGREVLLPTRTRGASPHPGSGAEPRAASSPRERFLIVTQLGGLGAAEPGDMRASTVAAPWSGRRQPAPGSGLRLSGEGPPLLPVCSASDTIPTSSFIPFPL